MATETTNPVFMAQSADYQIIMAEIKKSIDKNDALFKLIQQSNYPNAGSYSSDLLNYKIDTQITDLKQAREQVWDFLLKKYNENTKLRTYYFTEIRKIDNHIADLNAQKQELIDDINGSKVKTDTSIKEIKNEKYSFNKMEYYLFLYKILVFVQITMLAVITLCILDMIPKSTCLVILIIILIATVGFVAYYVFFVNVGRNQFSWAKFEHNNDVSVKGDLCSNDISAMDKEKAKANAALADILSKNKADINKCSTDTSSK
jgi:hypothetical protein